MQYQNKKIFIVDDDMFSATIIEKILKFLGCSEVYKFNNGEECVKNLYLNPEIVFLDYQMPGMNGIEVLQKIKSYYPGISVIFTTRVEDMEVALVSLQYGSIDFLLKKNICKNEIMRIFRKITNFDGFSLGWVTPKLG